MEDLNLEDMQNDIEEAADLVDGITKESITDGYFRGVCELLARQAFYKCDLSDLDNLSTATIACQIAVAIFDLHGITLTLEEASGMYETSPSQYERVTFNAKIPFHVYLAGDDLTVRTDRGNIVVQPKVENSILIRAEK